MNEKQTILTESEWRIMEILWQKDATLMELVRELAQSAGWAKSTVTTMVRRMETKGLIGHKTQGRTKIFHPLIARKDAVAAETDSLLQRAYHGSMGLMLSTLVRRAELTEQERSELYALLEGTEAEAK